VDDKVKEEVFDRDDWTCQNPECEKKSPLERTPHHCLFKSKYFGKDRDDPWNLVTICMDCHYSIHFQGNQKLRYYFEKLAKKRNEKFSNR